jgi:hypothetical protein
MNVGDLVTNIKSSYPETKLGQLFLVMSVGKYDVVRVVNAKTKKMELYSVSYLEVVSECR